MIIKSKIVYTEHDANGPQTHKDDVLVDLTMVGAVMPGDNQGNSSILFVDGRDVLLQTKYSLVEELWLKTKEREGKMRDVHNLNKDEG